MVPWAREGHHFTVLLNQVGMSLVREMPAAAAARLVGYVLMTHYLALRRQRAGFTGLERIRSFWA